MDSIASHNLKIVLLLTMGFSLASIFGYITERLKLSPILGYLIGGYLIGPFSPGFVADKEVSNQLAEIGVILMMFGVGLHFKIKDLINVKNIAIPGAIVQTFASATACVILLYLMGWSISSGVIIGLSVGVASTVVLIHVLSSNDLLNTPQGHVSVGWLIVEDIFTVAVLVLIPTLVVLFKGNEVSFYDIGSATGLVLLKFVLLALIMFTLGKSIVNFILLKIAKTRSNELLTLSVLALTFIIAVSTSLLFGMSIALGAFIAGMVIGQTEVRHQAAANSIPMKDAFVVIFFLSVGMLFNPYAIVNNFSIFAVVLAVILLVKPISAFLIVALFRYPLKVAVTVAVALSQIGEFSFILSEEAMRYDLISSDGYDVIVACALVSISINPLLFKVVDHLSKYFTSKIYDPASQQLEERRTYWDPRRAVVVGFGPIGHSAAQALVDLGFLPIIIDSNVDTVARIKEDGWKAVYGDATLTSILKVAQIEQANMLVITNPDVTTTISIINSARHLNKKIKILARVRYLSDKDLISELKVDCVCCEEESSKALTSALLKLADKFVPFISNRVKSTR